MTVEMRADHEKHISDKEIARNIKEAVKNISGIDKDTSAVASDLEKVLLCPQGPTSSFY